MNTFLFFRYGIRMLYFFFLFSQRVQILKTEYKYGQYCTPLSQSDCRYIFVWAIRVYYCDNNSKVVRLGSNFPGITNLSTEYFIFNSKNYKIIWIKIATFSKRRVWIILSPLKRSYYDWNASFEKCCNVYPNNFKFCGVKDYEIT